MLQKKSPFNFISRFQNRINECENPLCVGLDPFISNLPPIFGDANDVKSWDSFFTQIIDIISPKVPVLKPQIGLFEPWGGDGVSLVSKLCKYAKKKDMIIILDAKRGDIGTTAEGYANAYLGDTPVIDADCITLNPYMGIETLEPFVKLSEKNGKTIAVLVHTSNKGAQDFQELDCGGMTLWEKVGFALQPIEKRLMHNGASSLMVVMGATWPHQAKRLREILPFSQFLIPGYGAQGASAIDAMAGFIKVGNKLEGGIINSSRGILYPKGAFDAKDIMEWKSIIQENLDLTIKDLQLATESVIEAN